MLRRMTAAACVVILGLAVLTAQQGDNDCQLSLQLVDTDIVKTVPGWVRFRDSDGKRIDVAELFPRDISPGAEQRIDHWFVIVQPTKVKLPRRKITIEALYGLETELARVEIDLTDKAQESLKIPLKFFHRARLQGYQSANTHLHLMKLSREESDRYLREIPRADGLDVLFLSYLERADVQKEYISNRYTQADLDSLTKQTGVAFGNGEEHRHNFTAQGQGFGHVMLLDIKQLILPVSIGQGIMKTGTDGLPVQRGIDQARRDGATIVWCHNDFGLEDIPNMVTGRIQALNIFDGNRVSSYKHSFYRYLNAGLKVPFSTGTDWFMYDLARVYVPAGQSAVTPRNWLKLLAAGRSYITNGPFLELRVAGRNLGDTIKLDSAGEVEVTARAAGRVNFEKIELVQNGKVIQTETSHAEQGHFVAQMKLKVKCDTSGWLALRLPPQPVKDDAELTSPVPLNELGQPLFAHTSPIYMEVAGQRIFDREVAQSLVTDMEQAIEQIKKQGQFANAEEQSRVLSVYAEGIDVLKSQLSQ